MPKIKLSDYDYHLPKVLIAQEPLRPRDSSKLLVIKERDLEHRYFRDIFEYLQKDDVLVLNNTKVMANKLYGKKSTGAEANIIIEEKEEDSYRCRVQTSRPRPGVVLEFPTGLKGKIVRQEEDLFWIEFNFSPIAVLEKYGELPAPNYVRQKLKRNDHYQTTFAEKAGSLAAPTSGLHFSKSLINKIKEKGVKIVYVTLHISFGTFKRIDETLEIENHKMDPEFYSVSQKTADTINNRKGRLVICGTTAFKTLESCADDFGNVVAKSEFSELFIYPGHKFKVKPDLLITNFHLPKSTLVLLVSAYFGKDIVLNAYKEAVKEKYRFFSLGDACLFIK